MRPNENRSSIRPLSPNNRPLGMKKLMSAKRVKLLDKLIESCIALESAARKLRQEAEEVRSRNEALVVSNEETTIATSFRGLLKAMAQIQELQSYGVPPPKS